MHRVLPNGTYVIEQATDSDSGIYTCGDRSVHINVSGRTLLLHYVHLL